MTLVQKILLLYLAYYTITGNVVQNCVFCFALHFNNNNQLLFPHFHPPALFTENSIICRIFYWNFWINNIMMFPHALILSKKKIFFYKNGCIFDFPNENHVCHFSIFNHRLSPIKNLFRHKLVGKLILVIFFCLIINICDLIICLSFDNFNWIYILFWFPIKWNFQQIIHGPGELIPFYFTYLWKGCFSFSYLR